VVNGASPTASGLRLLPMVVGILLTSTLSGQLISRLGRYKVFPIAGTALMTVGLFLLSRMNEQTSLLVQSLSMLVLVIVVQNAVEYRNLGAATSDATVFLVAVPIAALAFVLSWLLPEVRLAQRFQVPAEQLTPSIATLQEKGLVTLIAPADGQGEGQLQLTSAGQETLRSLTTALHDNLSALLDGWSPEQEAELATLLHKVTGDLLNEKNTSSMRSWPLRM
jgi:DNA-binding MarR family transcriptional regulator